MNDAYPSLAARNSASLDPFDHPASLKLQMLDPDLQVADKALWLLAIARSQSASDAALLIKPVKARMQNRGNRTREIEEAQSDAWIAVCALLEALEKGEAPSADLWDSATKLTLNWRSLLTPT